MSASFPPEVERWRSWAVFAHLAVLFNFLGVPLGGLIGAIIIYVLHRDEGAYIRENARAALNMEITLAIVDFVCFGAFVVLWFSMFVTLAATAPHNGAQQPVPRQLLIVPFVLFVAVLANFLAAVNGVFAALAANRGEIGRYFAAIPFVRSASAGRWG